MTEDNKIRSPNAITESVLAVNQLVLGSAASTAMASMYVSMAHAAGVSTQNSVTSQQHLNILGGAAVAAGTGNILWEGLTREVAGITVNDRLNYWQKMMMISSGQTPQAEGDKEDAGSKAASESETSATPGNIEGEGEKPEAAS